MSDKKRQSLLKGLKADTTDSTKYVQSSFKKSIEWQQVSSIADRLLIWCNDKSVREKIAKANLPETNSKEVQNVLLPKAQDLGFSSEAKGLFSDYKTNHENELNELIHDLGDIPIPIRYTPSWGNSSMGFQTEYIYPSGIHINWDKENKNNNLLLK